jgi:hypothetical protein
VEVNPQSHYFGEITPPTEESEAMFAKLVEEGKIVARGPEAELKRLQDDLRKAGYRKQFNTTPLRP